MRQQALKALKERYLQIRCHICVSQSANEMKSTKAVNNATNAFVMALMAIFEALVANDD